MASFSTLISTLLKMLFIGVFAVGGVFAGKKLRERKDAKNSETKQNGKKKESQKMRFLFKFHYIDKPSKSLYNQNLADRSEEDKDESLRS